MTTKLCIKCKLEKSTDEFYRQTSRSDGLQKYCKICQNVYFKKWADKSPSTKRKNGEWKKARVEHTRSLYKEYMKDIQCIDCQYDDWRALEWDHTGELEKVAGIGPLIARGRSWEAILEEIDKCEPRCANCHRIKTAERGNFWTCA